MCPHSSVLTFVYYNLQHTKSIVQSSNYEDTAQSTKDHNCYTGPSSSATAKYLS